MYTEDLYYELPPELIAQQPAPERAQSRLLVLDRSKSVFEDRHFFEINAYLQPGDLLMLNNTKVLPARFYAQRHSGAHLEGLFLSANRPDIWEVLLKNARKLKAGETFLIHSPNGAAEVPATFLEHQPDGHCRIQISGCTDPSDTLDQIGYAPLPPYIKRSTDVQQGAVDRVRYQTVFADIAGAVAAPTAGLHFTDDLLEQLRNQGIQTATITLHVGIGTFKPVTAKRLEDHTMHAEEIHINETCVQAVNTAKAEGRRVIAVGTTTTRALESAALHANPAEPLAPFTGPTSLFITPGYDFKIVDGLITNFHLPKSTLLALVGALAGMDRIKAAYAHAIKKRYRFYSYGDAMLII